MRRNFPKIDKSNPKTRFLRRDGPGHGLSRPRPKIEIGFCPVCERWTGFDLGCAADEFGTECRCSDDRDKNAAFRCEPVLSDIEALSCTGEDLSRPRTNRIKCEGSRHDHLEVRHPQGKRVGRVRHISAPRPPDETRMRSKSRPSQPVRMRVCESASVVMSAWSVSKGATAAAILWERKDGARGGLCLRAQIRPRPPGM